jgi:hypothetical protein
MENLVAFRVLELVSQPVICSQPWLGRLGYSTPWRRVATYQVPDLPVYPPRRRTCARLWMPKGRSIPKITSKASNAMLLDRLYTAPVTPQKHPFVVWMTASNVCKTRNR